jgi:hypothetical protein
MAPHAFALAVAATLASQGFYPIGEDHGVRVFRRDAQRGIELGAEGEIAAPPDVVLAALTDYPSHAQWIHGVRQSRVLTRGERSLDVYQRLDLPLIDDRDFTLRVSWGEDGAARWLRFAIANERGPQPIPGVVRVRVNQGSWYLAPIGDGRATRAMYQFHLDLAGSIPAWLGKSRAGKDLPGLFQALRHRVEQANAASR